jgi:hypothetical protein
VQDWEKLYKGPCRECGEKDNCYKSLCLVCRSPARAREMVRYGVLPQTAKILIGIADKCNGDAEKVLQIVHPRVMQNLRIENGKFKVIDKSYRWHRRVDWVKVEKDE